MKILVFIGPSGSGKSTVVRRIVEGGLIVLCPTWTTRPQRPDEQAEGGEHIFVTETEFASKQAAGDFMIVAQPFSLQSKYGLEKLQVDTNTVQAVMLRAPYVAEFMIRYPAAKVYQVEAPTQSVEAALKARNMQGEPLGSRLSDLDTELMEGRALADRIFLNDGTIDDLEHQIRHSISVDFGQMSDSATI